MHSFHENRDRIYAELTFIKPLKGLTQKVVYFCRLLKYFEASSTNSVDQDQTAPVGSGSNLFACMLMLTNKLTFSDVVILLYNKRV